MKKLCLIFITCAIGLTNIAVGQTPTTGDCLGAIPICTSSYNEQTSPAGPGNYPNETDTWFTAGCIVTEENSIWYSFTVAQSGDLEFIINPNDIADDYDWMLFNMTNANCEDIYDDETIVESCNTWGSQSFIGGINGPTGISTAQGGQGSSNGPGENNGPPFNQNLPVQAGDNYVLLISNHSGSSNGYTIDFMENSYNALIYDNILPSLGSISNTITCGTTEIELMFSEPVACSSVSIDDFTIAGPTNISVTSIQSDACDAGATYDNIFTLTLSSPLTIPGNYQLILNDNYGGVEDPCGNTSVFGSINFDISNFSFNDDNLVITDESCDQQNGSIVGLEIDGVQNLNYTWNNNATTLDLQNLSAGNYTLTVSDGGLCSSDTTFTIANTPGVSLDLTGLVVTSDSCGQTTGAAIGIVTNGGVAPFTFSWTNSQNQIIGNDLDIFNLSSGNYYLSVRDSNFCTDQAMINIPSLAAQSFDFSNTAISLDTCLTEVGGISGINIIGGQAPFSYTWDDSLGNLVASTLDLQNIGQGDYTLTVTDQNACAIDTLITIDGTTGQSIDTTALVINSDLCSDTIGQINGLAINQGTPPYSYSWFDANNQLISNQLTLQNVTGGDYALTVEDAMGCAVTQSFTINSTPDISVDTTLVFVSPDSCSANTGSVTGLTIIGGSQPFNYNWTDDTGQNLGSHLDLLNMESGNYFLQVMDDVSCMDQVSFYIPSFATQSFDFTNVIINEDTCMSSVGGVSGINITNGQVPFQYNWTDTQGNTVSSNIDLQGMNAGTYFLEVMDANGCSIDTTINIAGMSGQNIDASLIDISEDFCYAGIGEINGLSISGGNPPYTYTWLDDNSQVISNQLNIDSLNSGDYTLLVEDASGCIATDSYSITNTNVQIPAHIIVTDASCQTADGTITVQPSASPYTPYSYSLDGTNFTGSPTFTDLSSGNYSVTIQNALGCTETYYDNIVNEDLPPVASFTSSDISGMAPLGVSFTNESINASTYVWMVDSSEYSSETNFQYEFIEGGDFTVTLLALNGANCIDTMNMNLTIIPEFHMYAPNGFSPNGDGINDQFQIYTDWRHQYEMDLYIFNRWGNQIYHSKSLDDQWDGTYQDNPCQEDVYLWRLVIVAEENNRKVYMGSVALIK